MTSRGYDSRALRYAESSARGLGPHQRLGHSSIFFTVTMASQGVKLRNRLHKNWCNSRQRLSSGKYAMPAPSISNKVPDEVILRSLEDLGLLEDVANTGFEALTGGVSSDIWKVSTAGLVLCVKRALLKLKVEANWFAPVEQNRYEVAWYQVANEKVPGSAPRILAYDDKAMLRGGSVKLDR